MAKQSKGYYSKSRGMNIDNFRQYSDKQIKSIATASLKYTRVAYKNVVKETGGTYATRQLLESPFFKATDKGTISSTVRGKTRGELIMMIKTQQEFAKAKSSTVQGISKGAKQQRDSLQERGYEFQEEATNAELDGMYSMIRDVINAFGDQKSPTNSLEATLEIIQNNRGLSYNTIKEIIIDKIQRGEFVTDKYNNVIGDK